MRLTFRYLAVGLEVWLGVLGILIGMHLLISTVRMGTATLFAFQEFAGLAVIIVGAILVADAFLRELKVRVAKDEDPGGRARIPSG
jgi:hypothetical protein